MAGCYVRPAGKLMILLAFVYGVGIPVKRDVDSVWISVFIMYTLSGYVLGGGFTQGGIESWIKHPEALG